MHRILDSAETDCSMRFFSALNIAAWCKQIVDVWMLIFVNTTFALSTPAGSRKWLGKDIWILSNMLSMFRCLRQNSPFRSSSLSSTSGRCKCMRLRPKREAMRQTPPKGDNMAAPSAVIASFSGTVLAGRPRSNESSETGKLVRIYRRQCTGTVGSKR